MQGMKKFDVFNNKEELIKSEIPAKEYRNILQIVNSEEVTMKTLSADRIFTLSVSETLLCAVKEKGLVLEQGSLFCLDQFFSVKFDLIIITEFL